MTFGTMRHSFREVAPTIPSLIVCGIRLDRCSVEIEKFPEAYEAPDSKREGKVVGRRLSLHGGQSAEIGHQVLYIFDSHMGIARVRQRGVQVLPIGRNSTH